MAAKKMQQELDNIYCEFFSSEKLQHFKNKEKLSAPFLISVSDHFIKQKKRILFIGKETAGWLGKLSNFIECEDSIEIMKQRYSAEFFGGAVKRLNDEKYMSYKPENNWKNRFFVKYKEMRKELLNDKGDSLLWLNLLKMDSGDKSYSKNTKDNEEVVKLSKEIFLKEWEILKPDFAIFATGYKYDSIIKLFFGDAIAEDSNNNQKRSLWKFKIGETQCFRTWHPQTIKYKPKPPTIDECYGQIAQEIKN